MKDVSSEAEKRITQPPFPALPDALVELLGAKGLVVTRAEAVAFLAGEALPKPVTPKVNLTAHPAIVANEPGTTPLKPKRTANAVKSKQVLVDLPQASFELALIRKGITAKAVWFASQQMHVHAGSTAMQSMRGSLNTGYVALRKQLINKGVLVPEGEIMRFTQDCVFAGAAQAADIIGGYSVNARLAWKDPNGKILGDYIGS